MTDSIFLYESVKEEETLFLSIASTIYQNADRFLWKLIDCAYF